MREHGKSEDCDRKEKRGQHDDDRDGD